MSYPQRTIKHRTAPDVRRGLTVLPLLVLAGLCVLCAAFLASAPLQDGTTFSLGGVGSPLARDFQPAETTPDGRGFRWTNGASTLRLPAQGSAGHWLHIRLSAPRPQPGQRVPVQISINGQPALRFDQDEHARNYLLAVPASHLRWGSNDVRIDSPTFVPQEENRKQRQLGVAVFDVQWYPFAPPRWLPPAQIAAVLLALVLTALVLARARVPWWTQVLVLVLFAAILVAMRHSDSRFVYRWHALAMTLGVCALLAAALPLLRRWRMADSTMLSLRHWARTHALALAGYVAATAVMLAPLLPHLANGVLGAPGDNWEYIWKMQWFGQALVAQHTSPIFAPQLFFPNGVDLTSSEIAPAQHLLYVPLTLLLGPVASYNLNILVSFVLSGFFAYLLACRLGMRRRAAFVAGIIFAFSVRRFFHATGHFGITASQWVPLLLYAWEGLLTRRRTWDAVLTSVAYALAVWSSMIYGVTAPLLVVGYTLVRLPLRDWLPLLRGHWRLLVLMGAVMLALLLPALQPYLEAQAEGLTYSHRYVQLILHATRPLDYLLPNPFHPLWGAWASRLYPAQGEQYASPGYATLILLVAGLWLGRRNRALVAISAVLLMFTALSLGPELPIGGVQVPLPAKALYDLPVFGSIRTWGRMTLYAMLCAGTLASVAVDRLLGREQAAAGGWRGWTARWGWLALVALIMFEAASALPISTFQPRAVDLWLRDQPGTGAVVNLPHKLGGPTEFLTLIYTDKPVSQGHGTFTPSAFREAEDIYYGFPSTSALQLMRRWQVDYIIIDEAYMQQVKPNWRADIARMPVLQPVYAAAGYSVFRFQR